MRKYRLSTKFRGPKSELVDYVGLSFINHYRHSQDNLSSSLNQNLNKVYIRNFYEYHHRKRPGETKTAKQEYDKELKEESKKQRLKELESQISFDKISNSSFDSTEDDDKIDGKVNDQINGQLEGNNNTLQKLNLQNGNDNQLTNGFKTKRKSTKKYTRTRQDRNSKDFFDTLLSDKKKSQIIENEYKKCVKIWKELNLAKQIQAYQLETLKDNYDDLEDAYNELNQKFKFVNRECKLIEKDIERLKKDYCRLVKHDLVKKNNFLKENDYIPIFDEIPSIDLDLLGDLKNYERAYHKYDCCVDYDEYRKLTKLNELNQLKMFVTGSCDSLNNLEDKKNDLVNENNNKIRIEINGQENGFSEFDKDDQLKIIDQDKKLKNNHLMEQKKKVKEQVEDVLYLLINRSDCSFFCNKVNQLIQDNFWLKNRIKRLHFDITNEKRKNQSCRKNKDQTNGVVEYEFSNNLDKQKPLNRHSRHTINVMNSNRTSNSSVKLLNSNRNLSTSKIIPKFGSRISGLNVFEIPTQKVEIFQMKLKMQRKEMELRINQLKKLKEIVDNNLEMQEKSLESSQRTEKEILDDQKQLSEKVKRLKIKEQELFKENENLLRKVHKLTEK